MYRMLSVSSLNLTPKIANVLLRICYTSKFFDKDNRFQNKRYQPKQIKEGMDFHDVLDELGTNYANFVAKFGEDAGIENGSL